MTKPHATHLFGSGECIGCSCEPHHGVALDFCPGLYCLERGSAEWLRLEAHIRKVNGSLSGYHLQFHAVVNRADAVAAWKAHFEGKQPVRAIAQDLGCSRRAVYRAWKRYGFSVGTQQGAVAPKRMVTNG